MLVLILRSAHAEDVRQTSNARARVSRPHPEERACWKTSANSEGRARVSKDEDEPVRPHASRRIAAQRCRGGGVLVRAATLLRTRGEDARCILAKQSQWGACPLDPCETDLRLQKTIDGSGPLFRGCYLQRIVQLERVIRESGAAA